MPRVPCSVHHGASPTEGFEMSSSVAVLLARWSEATPRLVDYADNPSPRPRPLPARRSRLSGTSGGRQNPE
jgi:hypothetical protein